MASRKKFAIQKSNQSLTPAERRREALRSKTFEELAEEQGVTLPFDGDKWLAKGPREFEDGFEDEIKALRRGRGPIRVSRRR
jgi:hypothetical protein